LAVRATHRIALDLLDLDDSGFDGPHLACEPVDAHTDGAEQLLGDRGGRHAARSLTGTGASPAAIVANAILQLISKVGVAGAINVLDRLVLAGVSVFIPDEE